MIDLDIRQRSCRSGAGRSVARRRPERSDSPGWVRRRPGGNGPDHHAAQHHRKCDGEARPDARPSRRGSGPGRRVGSRHAATCARAWSMVSRGSSDCERRKLVIISQICSTPAGSLLGLSRAMATMPSSTRPKTPVNDMDYSSRAGKTGSARGSAAGSAGASPGAPAICRAAAEPTGAAHAAGGLRPRQPRVAATAPRSLAGRRGRVSAAGMGPLRGSNGVGFAGIRILPGAPSVADGQAASAMLLPAGSAAVRLRRRAARLYLRVSGEPTMAARPGGLGRRRL